MRVLVTRAADHAEAIDRLLCEAGAEPIGLPTLRIEPTDQTAALDAAIDRLRAGGYDWVVVTSRNAVERLLTRFAERRISLDVLEAVSVATVGRATAERLTGAGIAVALVPERFTAGEVVAAMTERGVASARVLFVHGDLARTTVRDGLAASGAIVDAVEVYRTRPVAEIPAETAALLRDGAIDAVTLMSPSSARNFVDLLKGRGITVPPAAVACIGPVTASAAWEAGLRVDVVATESTAAGLVASLCEWRRREKGTS
jgi:uroporphyrinogen-III synthase